ncbi:hypothetical protein RHMOL_Rhmol11G0115300 [Rhododendron molle]|uniref:Uncharacterized protein n=1 Tax=Rhododendron molle TaxID=49168 RepID=A0ACC0LR15_RHOML|nr:hypothetical protein RHMOL_Rhmol11G0115300 [Rhododendron molle]
MLGIPKSKKRGGWKKQKCVMFRSTIILAALSSEGTNNRNRIIFDEAQVVWALDEA